MKDPQAKAFVRGNDIIGLFRYLGPMWIKTCMEVLEDLIELGFYPNPERYSTELRSAGIFVERMEVAMAAVLHKHGKTISIEKYEEVYSPKLSLLPEQQQREIVEFWFAQPSPGLVDGTAAPADGEMLQEIGLDVYNKDPLYVDNVIAGHYDIYSNRFTVDHRLGMEINLDYGKIADNLKRGSATIYVYYRDRQSKIIFPRYIDGKSAPNIADLVRQTAEALPGAKALNTLGVEIVTNPWLNLSWMRVGPRPWFGRSRPPPGRKVNIPRGPRTTLQVPADVPPQSFPSLAKILVDELRAAGKKVVVNLAGTGEVPDAINVNTLEDEQVLGVPRLLLRDAANIGEIFPAASVDRVVSNNVVRGTVNWSATSRGAFTILKPGQEMVVAPFAGDLAEHMAEIESAMKDAGFRIIPQQAPFEGHRIVGVKP
jgi:hypothetical protein